MNISISDAKMTRVTSLKRKWIGPPNFDDKNASIVVECVKPMTSSTEFVKRTISSTECVKLMTPSTESVTVTQPWYEKVVGGSESEMADLFSIQEFSSTSMFTEEPGDLKNIL